MPLSSPAKILSVLCFLLSTAAWSQTSPIDQIEFPYELDSGDLTNLNQSREVVFAEEVHLAGVPWLRLQFEQALLGKAPRGGQPTVLRITSLLDGAQQHLNAEQLRQWRFTSAYFNGDAVRIEVLTDAGAAPSKLRITRVWAGDYQPVANKSICGPLDNRVPSQDRRNARVIPIGCTVWLFDDANHTFGTAGHCLTSNFQIVEFNVPLSNSNGSLLHPEPRDQYSVDTSSIQGFGNGVGDDFGYFGCFDNTETHKSPYLAQGDSYHLVAPPAVSGNIRITGFGTSDSSVPRSYNQAQKTHVGPFVAVSGTTILHGSDTTGGNSGSPIIHEETGLVIGAHTHAGCDVSSGANQGTSSLLPAWLAARANPLGVCTPRDVAFSFPEGLPETLASAGATIRVAITAQNGGSLQANSAMLTYLVDAVPTTVAMTELSPGLYDAVFPELECLSTVQYRFTANLVGSAPVSSPDDDVLFESLVSSQETQSFGDSFQNEQGWTVSNDPSLSAGAWIRATPDGDGLTGAPAFDADGSGMSFFTGVGSDVDGGHSILVSPSLDATSSEGEAYLTYQRWYSNQFGLAVDDTFVISLSGDDGETWVTLESIGPTGDQCFGGWIKKRFRIADFVAPSAQMRVRFDVSDLGTDSLVEAAIDDFNLFMSRCEFACPGDLNGDRALDETDLSLAYSLWGSEAALDYDGDALATILDLLQLTSGFGTCP